MRIANILILITVIAVTISVSLSVPVFAQTVTNATTGTNNITGGAGSGPQNPKYSDANETAYDLLQQEANQTGIDKSTMSPITMHTDLPKYSQGDTIVMSGTVRDIENATDVIIIVHDPLQNLVSVAQLPPNAEGGFGKTFLATGPLWKAAGNYTMVAQYGSNTNTTTTFYYNGGNGQSIISQVVNATYGLQSGNQIYNIPYVIKGGTVTGMGVLSSQYTLEITLSTTSDGSITVTLPRALIDAKIPPPPNPDANLTKTTVNTSSLVDQSFIVTINGQVITQVSETKAASTRTLSIPFHSGDSKIDIVGTVIVPEFGPIAALVLAIAIISIIAVSAKTGLRFMPKY